jgi:hypothetical protein
VAFLSGGSGKASFYTVVPWQLYANALYQLPWGIDVSGAVFARKGGVYPVSLRLPAGADGTNSALAVNSIDEFHYDDLWNLDLRLAKTFKIKRAGLTPGRRVVQRFNTDLVLAPAYANNTSFTNTSQGAEADAGVSRRSSLRASSASGARPRSAAEPDGYGAPSTLGLLRFGPGAHPAAA